MRSSRSLLLALTLTCAGLGSTQAIPDQDLLLRVQVETEQVEFGKPFALTVQRVWSKTLAPESWDDRALSPIVLRPIQTSRREDGLRIEETRRFQAFLFRHGKVTVPAAALRAKPKNGGLMREVFGEALTLHVSAGLDPNDIGPVETLDLLTLPASSWFAWSAAGLVLLAGLSFLTYTFARRGGAAASTGFAPPVNYHLRATERLLALRGQQPVGDDENRAYYVEASDLLRSYIEDQFALRAKRMTTDEFLEAEQTMRALQTEERTILSGFLELCDLAKFAGQQPAASTREQSLDAAEKFLQVTQPTQPEGDPA